MDAVLVLWLQSDLYYNAGVSCASWCCVRGIMQLPGVKELYKLLFKANKSNSVGIFDDNIRHPRLGKHDIFSYIINNSMKLSPKMCFTACTLYIYISKIHIYIYEKEFCNVVTALADFSCR